MNGRAEGLTMREVLYVEDNAVNALLMESLFELRPDLHLLLAANCAEGLRLARARPPALLLIDLRLPDGDGAALLPALRALPGLQAVTAVAVTAEDTSLQALDGFDGLWRKPLHIAAVLAHLAQLLPLQAAPDAAPGRPLPGTGALAT